MTQSQSQTPPAAPNAFAAMDKKVADGIAADKAAATVQPQAEMAIPAAANPAAAPVQATGGTAAPAQQGDSTKAVQSQG